ncbi:MAG: PAC2 family protein [Acidimicrobiales bacterium]|nr:PAC2 family protein [Acidimicrobiales bacterium]
MIPELYSHLELPELERPTLLIHLEGWIDAGHGGLTVVEHLLNEPSTTIGEFDTDLLLDHRARRPILHVVDGVSDHLSWPSIQVSALRDDKGHDVVLVHGVEPDHLWGAFIETVLWLIEKIDAVMVIGLGAYPAALPHTRPSRLACTASDPALIHSHSFTRATLDVPAGLQAAIEYEAAQAGRPAIGLWAQVPHYLTQMPNPAAAVALLEGLQEVAGLTFDETELREQAIANRNRIDGLVAGNEEHLEMLRQLEEAFDSQTPEADIPTGEDLAAEFQQFLRDQD